MVFSKEQKQKLKSFGQYFLFFAFIFCVMFYLSNKNRLVTLNTALDTSKHRVQVQLQARYEHISFLMQQFKLPEKVVQPVLQEIRYLRQATDFDKKFEYAQKLETQYLPIIMTSIKSKNKRLKFTQSLKGSQERIKIELKRHNANILQINKEIKQFPKNVLVKKTGSMLKIVPLQLHFYGV
ncbi:hypothetical protein HN511_03665 [bacterium]|jgi:hypothetical protein|nr:hypothetical protein [bacterium]